MIRYLIIYLLLLITISLNILNAYQVVEEFDNPTLNPSIKYTTQKSLEQNNTNKTIKNITKTTKHKKDRNLTKTNSSKPISKIDKSYKKAKLVIIIDDISHRYQLNKIKRLGLKITPSIFPPNKMNMKNHLLAKGLKHYIIHLPLQSDSKQMNKMHKTLFVNDTKNKIEKRIKEIRKLFPTAKYINNHTGSVFTSNYKVSKILYKYLTDNGFIFIDSRTTQNTKIPKIAKDFHKRYLKADFFIDNKLNTKYIIHQINKGIALAKKRGYAVIIGHPHNQTFKALKQLKNKLKSINLIYIDELW